MDSVSNVLAFVLAVFFTWFFLDPEGLGNLFRLFYQGVQ